MDVKGAAALVTGGASGLGRATAEALVKAGAKVTLLDRNANLVESTATEIGALAAQCDVTSADSVTAAITKGRKAHGIARICINCAGIGGSVRIVDRKGKPMDLDHFRKVVEVNLIGTFNTLRLAAADMSQSEPTGADGMRGVIVNTASVAGYEGQIGQAAYTASKGGIIGLTIQSARDLSSHGVRVCTIAPGIMLTPLLMGLPQDALDSLGAQVPMPKRTGHASEYASLAMEIVRNNYLNGETIRLDGAIRMGPR
jgi:NAD(P)-dependent dehydrogenase (short-subunit alcohol dehydrogenase family)